MLPSTQSTYRTAHITCVLSVMARFVCAVVDVVVSELRLGLGTSSHRMATSCHDVTPAASEPSTGHENNSLSMWFDNQATQRANEKRGNAQTGTNVENSDVIRSKVQPFRGSSEVYRSQSVFSFMVFALPEVFSLSLHLCVCVSVCIRSIGPYIS